MLTDDPDLLVWSGDYHSGSVKSNMVYESILANMYHKQPEWWFKVIWKSKAPQKVKCFTWLLIN